ncbi:MAG: PEP-CTERM sorting domain-containing protein [Pirellulales bacterium]
MSARATLFGSIAILAGLMLLADAAPQAARAETIGLNFTGVTLTEGMQLNSNSGYAPPDGSGAVNSDYIVQLINGAYAVYDKSTGNQTELIAAKQFWINAGVNPGNDLLNLGVFNERILYDPTVDRWFAVGLSGQSTNNNVMIARSDTSDPTGGWKAVSFLGNDGGDGKFADFATLGIDADGVYVTTNNFPMNSSNVGFEYAMVHSIPKADLLATTPSVANMTSYGSLSENTVGFSTIQPVTNYGPTNGTAPLVAVVPAPPGETSLYRWDITGTAGPGAGISEPIGIPTSDYSAPPPAAQPDFTASISTIDGRIASNVYQVGDKLYAVHNTTLSGNPALSVLIFDEMTNQLIQEVILGDPSYDYFNASIAANHLGDIVVGFTRSGFFEDGTLSAVAIVGHTVGDVVTFGDPLVLQAGLVDNYHFANGRWGDYTSTVVDPDNPFVFWTFQQYALSSTLWATQVTQIIVPEPASVALAAIGLSLICILAARRRRQTGSQSL